MQGIGEILRKTRESKGITLEEVSQATKIRSKYLEAIEQEEFQLLPGEVYARGFATAYLKYLGIIDSPEVQAIMKKPKEIEVPAHIEDEKEKEQESRISRRAVSRQKQGTSKKTPAASFEEKPLTKKSSLIVILSVAAIILLLALQWVYSKSQQEELPNAPIQQEEQQEPQTEQTPQEEQQPEESVPEEQQEVQEPIAPVYEGLEMQLEILDANANAVDQCWMQITVDGKKTETTMSEGQIQEIQAVDSIRLNLGNAGVVKVTINGQNLGVLGGQGEVVRKEFKTEDYGATMQ